MKRLYILVILLCVGFPRSLWAQSESLRAQISEVQMNYGLYFRGDVTDAVAPRAMERAVQALWREVDQYSDTTNKTVVSSAAVTDKMKKVVVARGDQFRAFVYVKKADVIVPASENVLAQVPSRPEKVTAAPEPSGQKDGFIEQLNQIGTLSELQPFLVQKKEEGVVLNYNRYAALEDASPYYIVIYSLDRTIVAILSPGREERINLKTNRPDSLDNYKGYGAIAVLLSRNH